MDVNINEKLLNFKTLLSACSDLQYYISWSFHKGKVGSGYIFMDIFICRVPGANNGGFIVGFGNQRTL